MYTKVTKKIDIICVIAHCFKTKNENISLLANSMSPCLRLQIYLDFEYASIRRLNYLAKNVLHEIYT